MKTTGKVIKPLGRKAYGHIAHLPGSRMTPADHKIGDGQARIATEKRRDSKDLVIVQEKLDGSCVAVAKTEHGIIALGRAGYPADSSPHEQHRLFHDWAMKRTERFWLALKVGERLVGEWLAQAHGTRYELIHEPFVAFDIMTGFTRMPYDKFHERIMTDGLFTIPRLIHYGGSFSIRRTLAAIQQSGHGAIDPVEGAVWRVERDGVVDFLCKYVRPDKVDGCYLPEITGKEPVWNWRP